MTDYKEEQENEVSALESIYPDEFKVLSTEPYHKFQITVSSESTGQEDEEEEDKLCVTLEFTYTDTYPDEAPVYEVTQVDNVEDKEQEGIMQLLQEQIEENLGMAMVFALVSALQEYLNERVDDRQKEVDKINEAIEEEKRKKQEIEDNKLKGTQVTLDTFLEWKERFDAEMRILSSKKARDLSKKLTGRELFEKNEDLFTSDIALLEESDKVEVDESLFQDLDLEDLDIDEEMED